MSPSARSDCLLAALPRRWARELAPTPQRQAMTIRIVVAMTLVVVCSLAWQIPMLALSLLIVFFVGQEDTALTRLAAVVIVIGSSLSIALALLLLKFAMGVPLLRILGACLIAFPGVYFMRISRLGIVGLATALAVVYVQSLVDVFDAPESLTRFVLWVWVAINYPTLVTVLVNELTFPPHPERLLRDKMTQLLDALRQQLATRLDARAAPAPDLASAAADLNQLHRHFSHIRQTGRAAQRTRSRDQRRLRAVDRMYVAAANLAALGEVALDHRQTALLRMLRQRCTTLRDALRTGSAYLDSGTDTAVAAIDWSHVDPRLAACAYEIAAALDQARDSGDQAGDDFATAGVALAPALFKPDAWTNTAYARAALRTVVLTMLCYVLYTGIQWPGIHTVMLSCVIVAMPSLGTTTHKGINRVLGCALGSLAALLCTVFLMPRVDGLVGLLLLTIPAIETGAWIAAGSSRIAYLGHQFVFAFALAEFGVFGPTTDVTEIRDRMLGILLGVGVSIVAARLVWPEREEDTWRSNLRRVLDGAAAMLRSALADDAADSFSRLRSDVLERIGYCYELSPAVYLESRSAPARRAAYRNLQATLSEAQQLFFAVLLFSSLVRSNAAALDEESRQRLADTLLRLADQLETLNPSPLPTCPLNAAGAISADERHPIAAQGHGAAATASNLALKLGERTQVLIDRARRVYAS